MAEVNNEICSNRINRMFLKACQINLYIPQNRPMTKTSKIFSATFALTLILIPCISAAQANYEIQVYPGDTVEPNATMVEMHTNFTVDGRRTVQDGELPTHHQLHQTVEITHGFNKWFETGFYFFSSAQPGHGWQYVGS